MQTYVKQYAYAKYTGVGEWLYRSNHSSAVYYMRVDNLSLFYMTYIFPTCTYYLQFKEEIYHVREIISVVLIRSVLLQYLPRVEIKAF